MKSVKIKILRMLALLHNFSRLGTRMIAACVTALIAAILIFAAPEVGFLGAIGGLVMGGISAVLVQTPNHHA